MKWLRGVPWWDLVALVGGVAVVKGIWDMHHPAAWIIGGLAAVGVAYLADLGNRGGK